MNVMKKRFCVACFFLFSVSCLTCQTGQTGQTGLTKGRALPKITIQTPAGNVPVFVELATTPEEQGLGLMFRQKLPEDQGMLFIYPKETLPSFWMKNTFMSLDIIFINADGRIVFVAQNTTPFSETPILSAALCSRVLEVNAGFVEKHQIKAGALVFFDETLSK